MKNITYIKSACLFILFLSQIIFSQAIPEDSLYLGQKTPDNIPIKFAERIVSLPKRIENRITFSPDGKMCFFSIAGGATYYIEYKNGKWESPVLQNTAFGGEPFFSLDNKRVYLNSKKALNHVGTCDISYSEKNDTEWSGPVSLGSPLNSSQGQWHPCIVADGSIYFSSTAGPICRSQYSNGIYQKPVQLPYPINGVSGDTWGDPYVSPDESYIIFRSGRAGGYGNIDIYISYKKSDGSWTIPKNLGDKINTAGEEFSGNISPDGKYMFFGRGGDIYWVKADFIDSLRNTTPVTIGYLSELPPGNTAPKRFPLSVSINTFASDRIAISSDGKEIYYSEISDLNWEHYKIKYFWYANNKWNGPSILFDDYMAPALSVDGKLLFFESYSKNKTSFYSIMKDTTWDSPASSLFLKYPADKHYLQITNNGNYYVSATNSLGGLGKMDISKIMITHSDTTVQSLGAPLNSKGNEGDFYISKDESYIIFASPDRDGYGGADLFISFKKSDSTWTNPVNMGSTINSAKMEYGPYVTSDNKYLFFSRGSGLSDLGIYWIEVGKLIDSLKNSLPVTGVNNLGLNSPADFKLNQNYPNPFNPSTIISYQLPVNCTVQLNIYNILGQKIKTLTNSFQQSGRYSLVWNATDNNNNPVSSGIYLYRLIANDNILQNKMLFIK